VLTFSISQFYSYNKKETEFKREITYKFFVKPLQSGVKRITIYKKKTEKENYYE